MSVCLSKCIVSKLSERNALFFGGFGVTDTQNTIHIFLLSSDFWILEVFCFYAHPRCGPVQGGMCKINKKI